MPELPEVETIVRELSKAILGKTIKAAEVRAPNFFFGEPRDLMGESILSVRRRAKLIVIEATRRHIVLHLKMTGQLFVVPSRGAKTVGGFGESPYTRAVFVFTDGSLLLFNDLRRFGYCKIVDRGTLEKILGAYGPEPLDPKFSAAELETVLKRFPKRRIKQVLTDQTLIAGIGNIYADEALFTARISPSRPAGALDQTEVDRLHQAIGDRLKSALKYGGSSMDSYRRTTGEKGEYDEHRLVYRKTGQPCPRGDGGVIKRITIGGRGTHFCPVCQQ